MDADNHQDAENPEIPFHLYGEDGARYSVDVIRDIREDDDPHFDVDLVRSLTGRFGETIEQRLTLAEFDDRPQAEAHREQTERVLEEQGLDGLGDAVERVQSEPMLYDGRYLFISYPPEAEVNERAAAQMLYLEDDDLRIQPMAEGTQAEMQRLISEAEQDWAEGEIPVAEPQVRRQTIADDLPFTIDDHGTIRDLEDHAWKSHIDGGGTSHWFAIVETDQADTDEITQHEQPFELRYFRALTKEDGSSQYDSYPVMPLPDDDPGSAWLLPSLELSLDRGNVYMAQELAYDVADDHDLPFPPPHDLPALDPRPEYYVGYGVSDDNLPALEAVKTWMDGTERRFDSLTLGEYGMYEEAQVDEQQLDDVMKQQGLEAAMNLAENMAVAAGFLDPNRDDPRIFFADDAPPDPFTTERQRTLEMPLPDETSQPQYTVNAISANGDAHLNAWKSWGETEQDTERLIIPQPDWDTARENAEVANDFLHEGDLQRAMRLVERAAVEAGMLAADRDDPRLFTQGPTDPFTTIREHELAAPELDAPAGYPTMYAAWTEEVQRERETNAHLEGTDWFEATFDQPGRQLLQPIDDQVNYGIVVQDADPWTLELAVEKYWKESNGQLGIASQTIQTFDSENETQREAAEAARQGLLEVYDERGLEGMMHRAEIAAMESRWLDGHRTDLRLFRDGPPDRFETLAQQLADEPNPYWNTTSDWPEPEQSSAPEITAGSWDELVAQQSDDAPEPEGHYWQMHYRPVETPEGEPLGTALFVTEFPQLPPDFDDYVEAHGMDDSLYPTEARTLEMAHFANEDDAKKFDAEFRSYLIPGMIDGPELAPEVAKLEGLSGEWQLMDYQAITDYMSGNRTIVREESNWHLHNPNAERDAQIEAEEVSNDPIQQFMTFDKDKNILNVESATPDFDL